MYYYFALMPAKIIGVTHQETIRTIYKRLETMKPKEAKRLLVFIDKGVALTGDVETDWWLENQPDVLERVKQHKSGKTKSRPLKAIMEELGD